MATYRRKPGEVHGHLWYIPNLRKTGEFPQVLVDVNYWKTFVHAGLAADRLADWLWSQYPHSNIAEQLALCTECGECEQKCPQDLKIVEQIRRAKKVLGV